MTSAIESRPLSEFANPDQNLKRHYNDAGRPVSVCTNCQKRIVAVTVNDGTGESEMWKHSHTQFLACHPFGVRPADVSGMLDGNQEV